MTNPPPNSEGAAVIEARSPGRSRKLHVEHVLNQGTAGRDQARYRPPSPADLLPTTTLSP